MNTKQALVDHMLSMRGSALHNYIIPGLSSHLLTHGLVRMFEASREQLGEITPHSHRFDFMAYVLRGTVRNRLWEPTADPNADEFVVSRLTYGNSPGNYSAEVQGVGGFVFQDTDYGEGDWYGMTADQIHSIRFSRDALVLFFEGPELTKQTTIIEPHAAGLHCMSLDTPSWMFTPFGPKKEEA